MKPEIIASLRSMGRDALARALNAPEPVREQLEIIVGAYVTAFHATGSLPEMGLCGGPGGQGVVLIWGVNEADQMRLYRTLEQLCSSPPGATIYAADADVSRLTSLYNNTLPMRPGGA